MPGSGLKVCGGWVVVVSKPILVFSLKSRPSWTILMGFDTIVINLAVIDQNYCGQMSSFHFLVLLFYCFHLSSSLLLYELSSQSPTLDQLILDIWDSGDLVMLDVVEWIPRFLAALTIPPAMPLAVVTQWPNHQTQCVQKVSSFSDNHWQTS